MNEAGSAPRFSWAQVMASALGPLSAHARLVASQGCGRREGPPGQVAAGRDGHAALGQGGVVRACLEGGALPLQARPPGE